VPDRYGVVPVFLTLSRTVAEVCTAPPTFTCMKKVAS
jgi:hypothetical protein